MVHGIHTSPYVRCNSIRLASTASEAFRVVLYNKTMEVSTHTLDTQRYRYHFILLNKSLVQLVAHSKVDYNRNYYQRMPIEEARSFYGRQLVSM